MTKLLIATPAFGNSLSTNYCGSLLNTLKWCSQQGISVEVYFVTNDSHIGHARNACAAHALRGDFSKLFFIDADQVWDPEDAAAIILSKRTLIGGTYLKKVLPAALNFNPKPEHLKYFPYQTRNIDDFQFYAKNADENGEIEVQHIPTGFMCIDVPVLREIAKGCPTYETTEQSGTPSTTWDLFPAGVINNGYQTEDWFFCSIAREAGHPPYLNVNVIVDHLGQHNYRVPKHLKPKELA